MITTVYGVGNTAPLPAKHMNELLEELEEWLENNLSILKSSADKDSAVKIIRADTPRLQEILEKLK